MRAAAPTYARTNVRIGAVDVNMAGKREGSMTSIIGSMAWRTVQRGCFREPKNAL